MIRFTPRVKHGSMPSTITRSPATGDAAAAVRAPADHRYAVILVATLAGLLVLVLGALSIGAYRASLGDLLALGISHLAVGSSSTRMRGSCASAASP